MTSKESISPKPKDIDTHSTISMQELDPSPVQDEFPDLESGQYVFQSQGRPAKLGDRSEVGLPPFSLVNGRVALVSALQRYSTYPPTLFFALHFANTSLFPLATRSVRDSETYLLLTRPIYQSPGLEHVVLTVPILIHIASGIVLRNIRSSRRARLYGAETRAQRYSLNFWPRMSLQARLGYCFVPFLGAHVLVNRVTPLIVDGGSSGVGLGYVAHGFARNPVFWNVYYAVLAAVGMWHIIGGWATWMGWRVTTAQKGRGCKKGSLECYLGYTESEEQVKRKRKMRWVVNGVAAVKTAVWLAGALGILAPGSPFSIRYCSSRLSNMEAEPASGILSQVVQYDGKEYHVVKEGNAFILNPPSQAAASTGTRRNLKAEDEAQSVFYNPIQQFNRDLSVLAIKAYGEHVLASKKWRAERRQKRGAADGNLKGKKRKREDGDEEEPNGKGNNIDNQTRSSDHLASESHAGEHTTPSFTILDALSATGLRALRYASEIPFATRVVANDLSPSAIKSMKLNIEYNGLGKLIQPNTGDARTYMYSTLNQATTQASGSHTGKFDTIDLDPYGTAAPFMDSALQAVKDGGLLCVTCTDAGVWASNGYPEKSYALYGGVPTKGTHSHEGGLRLILHALAVSAAKYGLAIEPLLSLSIDFYARVFVRIHRSPAEVKFASGNTMVVYNCDSGCGAWSTQPLTQTKPRLDKKGNPFYHYGFAQGPMANMTCGPMWAGPLHNPHFIRRVLDMLPEADRSIYQTVDRIEGMLTTALEEDLIPNTSIRSASLEPTISKTKDAALNEDPAIIPRMDPALREPYPFYFSLSALSKVLHTSTISSDAFRGAVRHLGYQCTRSHTKPNTIRTDAPWDVIWEIMREWVRQKSPIKENAIKPGTAGAAIMAKSREDLQKPKEGDKNLSLLRKEIVSAAENGKDISDLVTKVEAALYRSGFWQALNQNESDSRAANMQEAQGTNQAHGTFTIKSNTSTLDVVFDESLGREVTKKRLVRYQINPRANWGPLNRASGRGQS
ncbi:S-adenosyl-L-methionine-dependent methyltransferase [Aspergillus caelatus]|uniref:tRNA (guanine(26)-N(2))-dimethyltransferase n=1 Tax=Aspergillus caelatus TaxID=61420 RepID=A0A5N6ZY00_9EURO|nr:S-adenosyl-L-methionine-dependent methyltransferase [Aspergillus caelatus]KAE8362481.1 S-adenosyl-L-methionine-dependent methyltransferase [Aspergillus caelatus]